MVGDQTLPPDRDHGAERMRPDQGMLNVQALLAKMWWLVHERLRSETRQGPGLVSRVSLSPHFSVPYVWSHGKVHYHHDHWDHSFGCAGSPSQYPGACSPSS